MRPAVILDVETALQDYLTANMVSIVGSGNAIIPVYPDHFPRGCKAVAVMISRGPGKGDRDLRDLDYATVDVWARHKHRAGAMKLMQNLDALLDGLCRKALNDDVFCLSCVRATGPTPMDSENNDLVRYFCSYDFDLRRGNGG